MEMVLKRLGYKKPAIAVGTYSRQVSIYLHFTSCFLLSLISILDKERRGFLVFHMQCTISPPTFDCKILQNTRHLKIKSRLHLKAQIMFGKGFHIIPSEISMVSLISANRML